ncbi:alkaline phosphatase family protein [Mucilaginibacter sp. FT3.2]|uniref:alkaline phosphatase family protein n=1 Tax=Mucilaginibacter sp. FT3.2 TaxID=2723090 RepID=UPI00160B3BCC|nr:alkaline phosphatase family protein [Mucilaginibacter sp. FT3.2]MBB6233281.1 membrane-anchored protein YejM (alkaline phosphatase superfamily) [Mucilaginibacter sp. FT3.2]
MKKLIVILLLAASFSNLFAQQHKTQNVIIVTIDGLRWQEVFRGADSALINSNDTQDKDVVRKNFWTADVTERRKKLMPFIWSAVVEQGQLYGNRDKGSKDEVANPYHFSYPGYNEIFTGFAAPKMNTNEPVTNPNMNLLEFLNKQKGFENKVATFASWERFTQILNAPRSGMLINAGFMPLSVPGMNDRLQHLNELQLEAPRYISDSTRIDFLTFEFAKTYLKQFKPRALYLSFDEPDDLAHAGNYKFYLDRVHQEDAFIRQLWNYIQTNPTYKDKTTLILTCDHGRGDVPLTKWHDHGSDVAHSEQTWFAVIGPDSPAAGEMTLPVTTYHKQLAQTIANLLGLDFKAAAGHQVGDPIKSVTTGK